MCSKIFTTTYINHRKRAENNKFTDAGSSLASLARGQQRNRERALTWEGGG